MTVKQWHGSEKELLRLRVAVQNHCSCGEAEQEPTCQAHAMLTDQTVLDHLVFVYRRRQSYIDDEFGKPTTAAA
jgi:hypothetical protein